MASHLHANEPSFPSTAQKAIFAGGCFWCIQPAFDNEPGVLATRVGYTGGNVPNPTYEEVSAHTTGHREALEIVFDSEKICYEQLLDIYWRQIDPFDAGGQFFDRGEPYTTAIYYFDEYQKEAAQEMKEGIEELFKPKKVATEVLPAKEFYPAEDYHQKYYEKSAERYNGYKKASGREGKLKNIWGE